ncbi:cobyric acid synthase [Dissulfurispira thermophila]|uniref:Cobyric acid synthase n=1 Tax=Dissulfurispira thermophila TaxID=2715679 RepID=A0A7G1H5S3_9BACT|nr:cobyric acid synthase [Dissulfurispira thermophila]BCB97393.1 cobyric acid synthase [Dissulfurispira thermophila]
MNSFPSSIFHLPSKTRALMIQGTGSGAGKSLIVTALCRIFKNMGIDVAPFKAQNMALNSYITLEGGEIGRAQALQAEAAKIEPEVDMNPILLKASGEKGCQVIIHGKVHSQMKAREYYAFKKTAWEAVKESFNRLSQRHELIIMEGAGSPAEINLMDADIVNMSIARHAKAPVILVGDIDKGGVFASLYGTVRLLGRNSKYIRAFVINKFRGDMDILNPGLTMIKEKTGKPVIGVLPYIKDIGLPEEDGLALSNNSKFDVQDSNHEKIKVVIVRLQYISNFTDFDPFIYEPDVELIYSNNPVDIENADIVILPGTKNTVKDLLFLKERRLDQSIVRAYKKGICIIGICGGYQMLGKKIFDPYGVESVHKEINGIGLLNIETTFERQKITSQVLAKINPSSLQYLYPKKLKHGSPENRKIFWGAEDFFGTLHSAFSIRGYEIHMGVSTGDIGLFKIKRYGVSTSALHQFTCSPIFDGSASHNCWGTYLHGIFENDEFRRWIINNARRNKNLSPIDLTARYSEIKDRAIENLAKIVKENIDIDFIKRIAKI